MSENYIKIVEPPKPEFLFTFFTTDNVLLARIRPNGEVEFGPGYTTDDELSRRVWQGLAHLPARLVQAEKERDEAREDLKDLEEDFQKRQEAHKCSTWDDYMVKCHCESIMAQLKKERDEARASDAETLKLFRNNLERLDKTRHALNALEAICHEFESTVAHADWLAAGSKGMSVPFHGDFAPVVQLPSVISRMRSWVRMFKSALGREE